MAEQPKTKSEEQPKSEEELKRKREFFSSTSELETSICIEHDSVSTLKQKKKKSKQKSCDESNQENGNTTTESTEKSMTMKLMSQMNQINAKLQTLHNCIYMINKKLENCMEKGDISIKSMINEMVDKMKESILNSLVQNIEVIEGKLFDREQSCDKMAEKVRALERKIDEQRQMNEELERKLNGMKEDRTKYENEAEQYSRRNNIKITGLEDTQKKRNST